MKFFESYYRAGQMLSDEDELALYQKIFAYMFDGDDSEPEGSVGAVWLVIKPSLDKTKSLAERGKRGGEISRKKANNKPTVSQSKANDKQTVSETKAAYNKVITDKDKDKDKDKDINKPPLPPLKVETVTTMIDDKQFAPVLSDAVKDWVKYKIEKREGYKPTGLKSLLTQIENKVGELGEDTVVALITLSMSQNWKGIIWEKAKEVNHANVQRAAKGWGVNHDPIADFIGGS